MFNKCLCNSCVIAQRNYTIHENQRELTQALRNINAMKNQTIGNNIKAMK
jgi:hypothetical protein